MESHRRNPVPGLLLLVVVLAFLCDLSTALTTLPDPKTGIISTGTIMLPLVLTGLVKRSKVKRALGK